MANVVEEVWDLAMAFDASFLCQEKCKFGG